MMLISTYDRLNNRIKLLPINEKSKIDPDVKHDINATTNDAPLRVCNAILSSKHPRNRTDTLLMTFMVKVMTLSH